MPITKETGEFLGLVMMFTAMGGILWLPTVLAFLTFCTPKKLLDTYFKEPHFTQTEVIMMGQFPGSFFRNAVFSWIVLLPSLDKKRNIRNCYQVMPTWYRLGLKIFMISNLLILSIAFGIMFFLLLSHIEK